MTLRLLVTLFLIGTGLLNAQNGSGPDVETKIKQIREAVKENGEPVEVSPELEEDQPSLGIEHFFPHPGIVAQKEGEWFGADHLYNLDNRIPVFIEILQAENVRVNLQDEDIQDVVEEVLQKTNISTGLGEVPPYPYFHILIMISKVKLGFAVYCEGRLFESVTLDRFHLDKNSYFQAVTWERQNLIVVPPDQLEKQVYQAVRDITEDFVERYRFYEDRRIHPRNPKDGG